MTLDQANAVLGRVKAVVLDMDGVVTETAGVHAAAWKRVFDEYLRERSERQGGAFEPFDIEHDYREYVDGKPRYDGVRSFLESRGIDLPYGDPSDGPGAETICGVGNRKNAAFLEVLEREGAAAYRSTVEFVRTMEARGARCAVISASRNAAQVLAAAGVENLFGTRVDGVVADELGLAGKPAPDVFVEAARRLGAEPAESAIVEDALAGVEAGRRGRFALVVGVDRVGHGHAEDLRSHGADIVVSDLSELRPAAATRPIPEIGPVDWVQLKSALAGRQVGLFLDYDGTLSPIVDTPSEAVISESMRRAVARLARLCLVAVVSGRDVEDVRERVGIDGLVYYGSHGLDVITAGGERRANPDAAAYLPSLDRAETALRDRLGDVRGCIVERKQYAIAVHYRMVGAGEIKQVRGAVHEVARQESRLEQSGGKKVFELRPRLDWDKGAAVRSLVAEFAGDRETVPIYIGDDETDEDAFAALTGDGIGIVVRGENDDFEASAQYALDDTGAVREFLDELARYLEARE